jgi:rare lipoprotein A
VRVQRVFQLAVALAALSACAKESASGGKPFNAPAAATVAQPTNDMAFAGTAQNAAAKPDEVGTATWYGDKFAGKKTTSGERFDPRAMVAAHNRLPFGTWVEVRRIDTGATIRVRIIDRGPHGDPHKVIDLSRAAAERIGIVHDGSARVELRIVNGAE